MKFMVCLFALVLLVHPAVPVARAAGVDLEEIGHRAEKEGVQAGAYILAQLAKTQDVNERYAVLTALARIKYAPALPQTSEILEKDPEEKFWQSTFIFGAYGDAGIPFLIGQLENANRNVRINSVTLLGMWLTAPDAVNLLRARFWTEPDAEVRLAILGALEADSLSIDEAKRFSRQVVAKEKDPKLVKYAQETIDNAGRMEKAVSTFVTERVEDAKVFRKEYALLFESYGKKGDYDRLGRASSLGDETDLKKLRERILLRNSDEAFDDFLRVNRIIFYNRLAAGMKKEEKPP